MKLSLLQKSEITPEIKQRMRLLFGQLNDEIKTLDLEEVLDGSDPTLVICAKEKGEIVGMASMAFYKVPSGYKGWIEDVVVHTDHRGKGIGKKMMQALIEEGKQRSLDEMLLFTGHHRLPAIQLYTGLGFQKKDSGLYRLPLK
ncbi:MAG: GNAT family N-acetyltransferase [Flavobacteriaceae bacterium]